MPTFATQIKVLLSAAAANQAASLWYVTTKSLLEPFLWLQFDIITLAFVSVSTRLRSIFQQNLHELGQNQTTGNLV